jgi:hypothetical protein
MVSQERIAAYCLSEGTTERLLKRLWPVKGSHFESHPVLSIVHLYVGLKVTNTHLVTLHPIK